MDKIRKGKTMRKIQQFLNKIRKRKGMKKRQQFMNKIRKTKGMKKKKNNSCTCNNLTLFILEI